MLCQCFSFIRSNANKTPRYFKMRFQNLSIHIKLVFVVHPICHPESDSEKSIIPKWYGKKLRSQVIYGDYKTYTTLGGP